MKRGKTRKKRNVSSSGDVKKDFEREGDHPDIWTGNREADANAGDEGIDNPLPNEQEPLSAAMRQDDDEEGHSALLHS